MSIPKATLVAITLIVVVVCIGLMVHTHHKSPVKAKTAISAYAVRYLPLGDSYTIGQSVAPTDRWPNQLVARLQHDGVSIGIVANPSVTGYTTQNLIDTELPLVGKLKPTFVTILIGVNDYVQGVDAQTFHKNLDYIITYIQGKLANPRDIVLVTIPDYGKTPTGAQFGTPASSEAGVMAFNAIIKQAGVQYDLSVADVFPVSQQVTNDPSLIASDGLHPSGKQYADWTDVIYPAVKSLLETK